VRGKKNEIVKSIVKQKPLMKERKQDENNRISLPEKTKNENMSQNAVDAEND
jgi:hypothetical protein